MLHPLIWLSGGERKPFFPVLRSQWAYTGWYIDAPWMMLQRKVVTGNSVWPCHSTQNGHGQLGVTVPPAHAGEMTLADNE